MSRPPYPALGLIVVALWSGCASSTSTPTGSAESTPAPPSIQPTPAAPARAPLIHLSIPEQVELGAADFPADWSFDLWVEEGLWSFHVHVIPQGQLIPLHTHPGHEELVIVAQGEGEFVSHAADGQHQEHTLGVGDIAWSTAGVAHQVRNRQATPLATAVLQRPEFGQNWYLLANEVRSAELSHMVERGAALPEGLYPGWQVGWRRVGANEEPLASADDAQLLYLVAEGTGQLDIEVHQLPLLPGHFMRIPPDRPHALRGAPELLLLEVRVPSQG